MKVLRRSLVGIAICFAFVFFLMSCSGSKVSKSYSNDINKAAMEKNYVTLETVKKDLGKECNDWTIGGNGMIFAVKGYESIDNEAAFNKLILGGDEKTTYQVLIVTFKDNNAVSAQFFEGKGDEISAKLEEAFL